MSRYLSVAGVIGFAERSYQVIQLKEGKTCTFSIFTAGLQCMKVSGCNVAAGGLFEYVVRTDINGLPSIEAVKSHSGIEIKVENVCVKIKTLSGTLDLFIESAGGFHPTYTLS